MENWEASMSVEQIELGERAYAALLWEERGYGVLTDVWMHPAAMIELLA